MFKFHSVLVQIESRHVPKRKPEQDKVATRSSHSQEYEELGHRRLYRQKAFFPRTTAEWNMLPEEAVTAETLELFKSRASHLLT
jgi:hypothetical protein